ncbi:MAG: hypothetical protein LBS19_11980 [Clostridiales bacterium]|jgi:hypothetical protein|nr:hypothetical protein [Clostridiales bacterium]
MSLSDNTTESHERANPYNAELRLANIELQMTEILEFQAVLGFLRGLGAEGLERLREMIKAQETLSDPVYARVVAGGMK